MLSAAEQTKVNILIVDDKPANICSVQAILTNSDYHLHSATSGLEALKCILHHDYAVILLDVMMPEMDGFEVARLVRQRGKTSVIPIIFLTAIATDWRYLQEGYAAGAVDYLQKPLDPDMVRAKVAVFVELHRRAEMIKEQESQLREMQRIEQERCLADIRQESERHFRKLADSLPQIVCTADKDGTIQYRNPRWQQLIAGVKIESWRDAPFTAIIHAQDRPRFLESWQQAQAASNSLELELRLKETQSEAHRWYLLQIQPEMSLQGELVGWLATFTDIDLQKKREETQRLLADASAMLTASQGHEMGLQQLASRITETFASLCVIDLTREGGRLQRLTSADERGLPLQDVMRTILVPDAAPAWGVLALHDGKAHRLLSIRSHNSHLDPKMAAVCLQEDTKDVCLMSAPIVVRGVCKGAVTVYRWLGTEAYSDFDLAVLVELCRHISLAMENLMHYEEVRNNNRLKDEFLALLSHELRTPLNSILGWTELVKLETEEPRVIEGLNVVERSAHTLTQLVNDLLDVSRIISGKLEISKQPVDVVTFLKNVIAALQPFAESKQVRVYFAEPQPLPKIEADPSRLEQIFWNLLNNAIKFTPKDGEVQVYARQNGKAVEVEIVDSGIGIKPDLMPHVFERFRQADSSSTRRHGGLGLGLAIVKHLSQLHDGQVTAHSAGIGRGATFTVTLPTSYTLLPVYPRPQHPIEDPLLEGALNGISILLVDDDPSTRKLTARQLAKSGAKVKVASSVREALELVTESVPDIVLTDIGMPEQDGFSLLRSLRQSEVQLGHSIRIAAFSAYASEDDAQHALEQGFDIYLTKPISATALVQSVVKLRTYSPNTASGEESSHPSTHL